MKSDSDTSDKIGKAIRLAGFESPDQGLTKRIMNRIEVAAIKRPLILHPVIGFRGWVLIAVFFIMLVTLSFVLPGNSANDTAGGFLDTSNLLRIFQGIDLPFTFAFQGSKILLLGLTGLLFWIVLDFLLSAWKWKKNSTDR